MKTFADQFTLLTDRMLYVGPANSSPPDKTALELSENEQDPTTQIVVAVSRSLLPLNRTKWAQIREVQFIVASESFNINIKGMRSWQDIQEDKYRNDDVNGSYVDGDILRPYIAYKRPLCKLTTCPSGAPGDSKGFTGLLESWLERGAEFAASEPDFPIRVVIGDDKCSGGAPCNGPLRPDTRYKYVYEYAIRHIRNKLNWMFKRLCNTGLPFASGQNGASRRLFRVQWPHHTAASCGWSSGQCSVSYSSLYSSHLLWPQCSRDSIGFRKPECSRLRRRIGSCSASADHLRGWSKLNDH